MFSFVSHLPGAIAFNSKASVYECILYLHTANVYAETTLKDLLVVTCRKVIDELFILRNDNLIYELLSFTSKIKTSYIKVKYANTIYSIRVMPNPKPRATYGPLQIRRLYRLRPDLVYGYSNRRFVIVSITVVIMPISKSGDDILPLDDLGDTRSCSTPAIVPFTCRASLVCFRANRWLISGYTSTLSNGCAVNFFLNIGPEPMKRARI
ncbi:hypothetical protein AGLY_013824 [Aphis glycines]|uniref:Uncharacterized protein n=1 Tax=Aphis glycines TaxID=307491 RepID=A0A6G0T617_APHGL|nr:hypothetical protein AGLY_013824 [Aphis glycines]